MHFPIDKFRFRCYDAPHEYRNVLMFVKVKRRMLHPHRLFPLHIL